MPDLLSYDRLSAAAFQHPQIARVGDALAGVHRCWLVGGAVRDLLLGGAPVDLDVTIEGDAVGAATRVAARLGGEALAHERFGTARVQAGDLAFDVVMTRHERYPAPGALPEVETAGLEADLARRDFTVNAIALGLSADVRGRVEAGPEAIDDLRAGRLRVLHDRSFVDDPTRLLRLARYGGRLGFEPEAATSELARRAGREGALDTISGTRIGRELLLALAEPTAAGGLRLLGALGLGERLLPGFDTDPQLGERALGLLAPGGRPALVRLAAAVRGGDRVRLRCWLDRLGLTAADRDVVLTAALESEPLARALGSAERPSQIASLVEGRPPEQLALVGALGAEAKVQAWQGALSAVRLEISGDDLIAAGVPPGPGVGAGLRAALAAKRDGELHDREAELRVAREAALASPR